MAGYYGFPTKEAWLAERKKHLTASDMAAILGVSRYSNPVKVWTEKMGYANGAFDNKAMEIGRMFERPIMDAWALEEMLDLDYDIWGVSDDHPVIAASLDAVVRGKDEGVEAKTAGIISGRVKDDDWGSDGTDQINQEYIVQVHTQMLVRKLSLVHMPTVIAGRGRAYFCVHRDEELIRLIIETAEAWWQEHVVDGNRPSGEMSMDIFKVMPAVKGKSVVLQDELFREYAEAKRVVKEAEAEKDAAELRIVEALGDGWVGASNVGKVSRIEIEGGKAVSYVTKPSTSFRVTLKKGD